MAGTDERPEARGGKEDDLVVRVRRIVSENRRLRRVVALQALDQAALARALRRARGEAPALEGPGVQESGLDPDRD